jgi:glycine betaine catabolism B
MTDRKEGARAHQRSTPLIGRSRLIAASLLLVCAPMTALAQTPADHEQHHPKPPVSMPARSQPTTASPSTQPASPTTPASPRRFPQAGGMMDGMGGMGEMMGSGQPRSPLYPSLMAVPDLTPERQQELERQATDLMAGGTAMMSEAFAQLAAATQARDAAAMQQANVAVRDGFAQLESGLALRQALDEGRAPRDVALDWFRREMKLVPLTNSPPPHGLFGLSWFHYIVMFILTAFAITMIGMYFQKMRRAEGLVARLAGTPGRQRSAVVGGDPAAGEVSAPAPTAPAIPSSLASATPEQPSKPNSWTGLLRVARIFPETPTVKSFRLVDPAAVLLPFTYLPGQFLTVTLATGGDSIKRSYTIASSATQRAYAEITVKREEHGVVSQFLHDQVHEGDTLQVTAASGKFTFTGEEASSVVLIGGGVGVTPMMSVARYLTGRAWGGEIFFLYGAKTEAEIIFREELEYLRKRYPNLHLMLVVDKANSPDWPYAAGRIDRELLEKTVPDLRSRRVHICGPLPMMNAIKGILAEMGVSADQIRTEVFQGAEQPRRKLQTLPAAQAKVSVVTFAKSNRTAMFPPTKTVLEASEDVGVNIDYSCRIGVCGVCRTKLLSGMVTMEVQDGLEPGDNENNIVLACQAKSTADVSVDA